MKTIKSFGDLIDAYYKLRISGINGMLFRIISSANRNKIIKAWNSSFCGSMVNWWSVPLVQKRWNLLISGNSETDYSEYVVSKYLSGKFNLKMLSPGCGTGNKELKYARFKNFHTIEAFNVSPDRIKVAKNILSGAGFENVHYSIADAFRFDFGFNKYDVVVFDSFLHHIKTLEVILEKIYNSLKPGGLLVINEYVGPNRFQFPKHQIKFVNQVLKEIPPAYRRRWKSGKTKSKIYAPGFLRMILSDPSESVKSEMILSVIREQFNVLEEKAYGGNILQLVLKDIAFNFINKNEETRDILERLFRIEDDYLRAGNKSDFVFAVYSK